MVDASLPIFFFLPFPIQDTLEKSLYLLDLNFFSVKWKFCRPPESLIIKDKYWQKALHRAWHTVNTVTIHMQRSPAHQDIPGMCTLCRGFLSVQGRRWWSLSSGEWPSTGHSLGHGNQLRSLACRFSASLPTTPHGQSSRPQAWQFRKVEKVRWRICGGQCD